MKKTKQVIVCVFAHPDDEAFGPGGTIATFAKTHDVYILCATRGEAGTHNDPKQQKKIALIRADELRKSAKILGVRQVYFLGFEDGTLSNNLYHKLASRIEKHLKRLKPQTVITFEPRGISGHIDHITVSMVATYLFHRFPFIKKLMYYCINEATRSRQGEYFIYFPPGYATKNIDQTIDVKKVWDTKLQAMYTHQSQLHDVKRILKQREGLPKKECFLILKK